MLRFSADPVSWKISSGSAKPVKDDPRVEIAWPSQNL